MENVDLIPSNINLSGAEIELIGVDDKEYILKRITEKIRRKYDYIIMDLSLIHIWEAQKRCKEMTELTGLDGLEKKKIKTYSGGMIRRLGITQALLENHICLLYTSSMRPL